MRTRTLPERFRQNGRSRGDQMRWSRDEARDGTQAENKSLLSDDLGDVDPLAASPRNSAHMGRCAPSHGRCQLPMSFLPAAAAAAAATSRCCRERQAYTHPAYVTC